MDAMAEQARPQQKAERFQWGTPAFRERRARHANLVPYEMLEKMRAPRGSSMPQPPVTVTVTQPVADALELAVGYFAHNAKVRDETNQHLLERLQHEENLNKVYRRFIENISDDHVEDMSWQDISAAAEHLLGLIP